MNLVDLVAILPFYIEKLAEDVGGLGDTRILRIVRLVRVFRVLKLGGRFSKMQVVGGAVLDSMDMLGMLGFLLLLSMILFSTLIYICERDEESAGDPFSSIPASFWWCIVTLMTVGCARRLRALFAAGVVFQPDLPWICLCLAGWSC